VINRKIFLLLVLIAGCDAESPADRRLANALPTLKNNPLPM
jgi:hypothetical protein